MNVLVINSGSSSIKYEFFDMRAGRSLASGLLEQIGEAQAHLKQTVHGRDEAAVIDRQVQAADHRSGFKAILAVLAESGLAQGVQDLYGIGHRVVHGGEAFTEPTRIDAAVMDTIRKQIPLAPLHNPANLVGIEEALRFAPEVPQVAVFDTAFHQSLPAHAYHYALPEEVYTELRVRRYGFHGTSHQYVTKRAAEYLGRALDDTNLIVFHLGNGASVTAVRGGRSVDTSLGMTPLEGLIMGTRSGDIDPAIIFYLLRETGQSPADIENLLNKQSGLKGITGVNDMREVFKRANAGDAQAELAIDMVAYRIKKYLGAYYAVLGRVDAVVFTAGIGEKSPEIRESACTGLAALGIAIDTDRNHARSADIREIQTDDSSVKVLVVPTDEEREIAEQTVACIAGSKG
jgi:acetate kinase